MSRSATGRSSPLYGWQAPHTVSAYGLLIAFGVGSFVALSLASGFLSLIWGPPHGPVLVREDHVRIFCLAGAVALSLLLPLRRWRGVSLGGMAVLVGGALTPLYGPLPVVRALVRAETATQHAVILATLACAAALAGACASQLLRATRLDLGAVRGSSRWGGAEALKKAARGFLVGQHDKKLLRYDGAGHLLTIAATRSGKGVGSIIPNLLNHPGSLVVTDPKGENYYVTARYRRSMLKHEVVAMDPFHVTPAAPCGFNPMDLIDLEGPGYVETAMTLAEMMLPRGTTHWILEGKALLYAFILHVAQSATPARRNLVEVRRQLTLGPEPMKEVLAAMGNSPVPQVAEGAGRILQKSDRERSGVFATAQSYTHFLSSPNMQHVLTQTDFSLEHLTSDRLSLYLVLPREHLSTFAPWLRLMVACCYYVCTHEILKRERSQERILFLLDEFANLGYMPNIKEAVSLGGGYGVTLWLILQDLAQLKREYPHEWESFIANSDVIQTFAVQDPFTSDKVARMLGQTTVWQRRTRKGSRREGSQIIREYDEESRPLLRPEEIRRLHPDRLLLLVRPYQPVAATKIRYFREPYFRGRFDRNPYVTN